MVMIHDLLFLDFLLRWHLEASALPFSLLKAKFPGSSLCLLTAASLRITWDHTSTYWIRILFAAIRLFLMFASNNTDSQFIFSNYNCIPKKLNGNHLEESIRWYNASTEKNPSIYSVTVEEPTESGSKPVPVWANSCNYVGILWRIRNGLSCLAQSEAALNRKRKGT